MLPTLNPPPLTTPLMDRSGIFAQPWARWLQLLQQTVVGVLRPSTPTGLRQNGAVYQGSGIPANSDGNDGDVYFRTDTPGVVNQRIYVKASGSWTGIL